MSKESIIKLTDKECAIIFKGNKTVEIVLPLDETSKKQVQSDVLENILFTITVANLCSSKNETFKKLVQEESRKLAYKLDVIEVDKEKDKHLN